MATFSPCHWHLTVQRLCASLAPLPLFFSLLLCLSRVVLPRPLNYVALLGCSPGALLLNISFPFALFAGCLVCKMRRCQCQKFSHCVRNSCSSQTHTHTHTMHTLVQPCVCCCLCVPTTVPAAVLPLPATHLAKSKIQFPVFRVRM